MKRLITYPMFAVLMLGSASVFAVDVRLSGFGDVIYGVSDGDPADSAEAALFRANGEGDEPLNFNEGFSITGVDFVVIADMTEAATFLGEINLQSGRGIRDTLELDVERLFVDYKIKPSFNLQTGLYFTPIGYFNRFLYSRAWLMNSIQVPDLFEEELNLVPTHSIGLSAHGSFPMDSGGSFNYVIGFANGRPSTPTAAVYSRDTDQKNKEFTFLAEWIIPGYRDNRFGISGWTDKIRGERIDTVGGPVVAGAQLDMSEQGLDVYAVLAQKKWELLLEYVYSVTEDDNNELMAVYGDDEFETSGLIAEFALRLKNGKLHPYIRYDMTDLPDNGGGPYLGLRGGERVYVPEFEAVMIGAAYDLDVHTRVKAELIHHLDGVRDENGLALQLAFGF